MKEITDYFQQEFDKGMQSLSDDQLKIIVNGRDVEIPRKLLLKYQEMTKFYDVGDIGDLKGNYGILSRTSYIPLCWWFWAMRNFVALTGYKNFRDIWKSLDDFLIKSGEHNDLIRASNSRINFKVNFNMASIDNVYLRNFDFIKREKFEACEFDIIDRYDNSILGIFPYREGDDWLYDLSREELENVLRSSEGKTFDLQFTALPEDYKIKKEGRIFGRKYKYYVPRGKKLLVEGIREERGEIDTPRIDLTKPLIHQLI